MGVGITYFKKCFCFLASKNKDVISTCINTECPLHFTKLSIILKIESLSLKIKQYK